MSGKQDEFTAKELQGVGCETIGELVLKIWDEAKESLEYDKRKFTILTCILEVNGII